MRLFISYSHQDASVVAKLEKLLISGGHDVWIDNQIRVGTKWKEELEDAIEKADSIVLALTPGWVASPNCQWEFVTAYERGKKVIPVLIKPTALPERISRIQYADFTEGFRRKTVNQRFLDDILALVTMPLKEQLVSVSKAELEKQIGQALILGNVKDSDVKAQQLAEANDISAQQKLETGTISNSSVTINQTVRKESPSKPWSAPTVLGLIFAFIGVVAAILAIPRVSDWFDSFAPPMPTSAPERMPANAFNVVVAGFGYQEAGDSQILVSQIAEDMTFTVYESLRELPQIDNIRSLQNAGVEYILETSPAEREAHAARMANVLGADVVLYGLITSDGLFNILQPEFYVTAEFAALEPELVGSEEFGNPIDFVGDSDDQITGATALQRRLEVLRFFLRGLALYLSGDFPGSRESFERAASIEQSGLEILNVFAGNAALREQNTTVALEHYDAALRMRPNYTRALIGRGNTLYKRAVELASNVAALGSAEMGTLALCADTEAPLPEDAVALAELALRCFEEANYAATPVDTADIDVKAAFGLGQVSLWLSMNDYRDLWNDVQTQLQHVTELYRVATPERQLRIRATAAHANAWLGLREITLFANDAIALEQALDHYETALALLRSDVNRAYNQQWIDLYGQQIAVLEDRLLALTPVSIPMNSLAQPSLTPMPEEIEEFRG